MGKSGVDGQVAASGLLDGAERRLSPPNPSAHEQADLAASRRESVRDGFIMMDDNAVIQINAQAQRKWPPTPVPWISVARCPAGADGAERRTSSDLLVLSLAFATAWTFVATLLAPARRAGAAPAVAAALMVTACMVSDVACGDELWGKGLDALRPPAEIERWSDGVSLAQGKGASATSMEEATCALLNGIERERRCRVAGDQGSWGGRPCRFERLHSCGVRGPRSR